MANDEEVSEADYIGNVSVCSFVSSSSNDFTDEADFKEAFNACGPNGDGLIRVSRILDFGLRIFGVNDQKVEVISDFKLSLDPNDIDPLINFDQFLTACERLGAPQNGSQNGVVDEKLNKNSAALSQLKKAESEEEINGFNQDLGMYSNWKGLRTSTPANLLGDESLDSFPNKSHHSYEAFAGDSILDPHDLKNQLNEAEHQSKKLTKENLELRASIVNCEETIATLQKQIEDSLKKKLQIERVSSDRIRLLTREVEDVKATLTSSEERVVVLNKRIKRLEHDNVFITKENDEIREQLSHSNSDLDVCRIDCSELGKKLAEQIQSSDDFLSYVTSRAETAELMVEKYKKELKKLNRKSLDLELNIDNFGEGNSSVDFDSGLDQLSSRDEGEFGEMEGNGREIVNNSIYHEFAATGVTLCGSQIVSEEELEISKSSQETERITDKSDSEFNGNATSGRLDVQTNENILKLEEELTILKEKYEESQDIVQNLYREKEEATFCDKRIFDTSATQTDEIYILDNDQCDIIRLMKQLSLEDKRNHLSTLEEEGGGSLTGQRDRRMSSEKGRGRLSRNDATEDEPLIKYEDEEGNRDIEDKIPVNLDGSCIEETSSFDYPSPNASVRKRSSTVGPLPTLHPGKTPTSGIIHEKERDHLLMFAHDAVLRGSSQKAKILTSKEWRVLKGDLEAERYAQYKKQDEGGEGDDGGQIRPHNPIDLDDEAEIYCENFPGLVDRLFKHMDTWSEKPSSEQLEEFSKRFEQLSMVFKTSHTSLPSRTATSDKELHHLQLRFKAISDSFRSSISKLDDHLQESFDCPDQILKEEVFAMRQTTDELDFNVTSLIRSSKKKGMLDIENRIFKMIEVMVFYLHILRNLYNNVDKDFLRAKSLLDEHGLLDAFTNNHTFGKRINNNHDKTAWDGGYLGEGEGDTLERFEDGRPKNVLQHLLGPSTDPSGKLDKKSLGITLKEPKESVFSRCFSEGYEMIRREFHWPWNWDQTWRGIKQGFSIILMVLGLFIILKSLFPSVGADMDPHCHQLDLSPYYKSLDYIHNDRPRI